MRVDYISANSACGQLTIDTGITLNSSTACCHRTCNVCLARRQFIIYSNVMGINNIGCHIAIF